MKWDTKREGLKTHLGVVVTTPSTSVFFFFFSLRRLKTLLIFSKQLLAATGFIF